MQKIRWSAGAKRPKDFEATVAVIQIQGDPLDWTYIEQWCAEHGTRKILAEARAEAASVWEDDPAED